jgi:hypothetical protein
METTFIGWSRESVKWSVHKEPEHVVSTTKSFCGGSDFKSPLVASTAVTQPHRISHSVNLATAGPQSISVATRMDGSSRIAAVAAAPAAARSPAATAWQKASLALDIGVSTNADWHEGRR